jgi:hypothetical protein
LAIRCHSIRAAAAASGKFGCHHGALDLIHVWINR